MIKHCVSHSSAAIEEERVTEREFTSLLIDLYRDSPELWKVKSKDYFNRNKRSAALQKITHALHTLKPDFTVEQLKKKIDVLRTNYNREYKAIEQKKSLERQRMIFPNLLCGTTRISLL